MIHHLPISPILSSYCNPSLIITFYVYVNMTSYVSNISHESMYYRIRICPFGNCIQGWITVNESEMLVTGKMMGVKH